MLGVATAHPNLKRCTSELRHRVLANRLEQLEPSRRAGSIGDQQGGVPQLGESVEAHCCRHSKDSGSSVKREACGEHCQAPKVLADMRSEQGNAPVKRSFHCSLSAFASAGSEHAEGVVEHPRPLPRSPRNSGAKPSASATATCASAGSTTGESSHVNTPAGKRLATRKATFKARRVLPMPGAPITVTSRLRNNRRSTSSSSRDRPTKDAVSS